MSLAHFNARTRYKRNGTGSYIKKFLNARARKYLRKKARVDDASGIERKRPDKQAKYDRELVLRNRMKDQKKKERQELAVAKMAAVVPRLTREEVVKLRVPEIDVQIRWHCKFDAQVPAAKDLKGKKRGDKVEILMDVVGRFLSASANQPFSIAKHTEPQVHHSALQIPTVATARHSCSYYAVQCIRHTRAVGGHANVTNGHRCRIDAPLGT
ncbi:hypothetical protein PAXRUDRAFT_13927 [Paxillus rubicundulus Ve08.2h10]|uniref:Uncharacterized protein n=1 Tax=Paxillus rubicundulus Ve08.2h10 TaxID=930991 RepID=A0A0D0DXN0_9AGAM|nr:hypothetical protein PAXRUDRAFT_13927 [Paxillus rubicundulus Ve08.2h10]